MNYREVSSRDLSHIRTYVRRALQASSIEQLEQQFLGEIDRIIPNDTPCWNNFTVDLAGALSVKSHKQYDDAFIPLYESFTETVMCHPVVSTAGWGALAEVPRRISDFEADIRFRDNPIYREVYQHVEANYQIGYLAAKLSDRSLIFTLNRKSSDFSLKELQVIHVFGQCMAKVAYALDRRQLLDSQLGLIEGAISERVATRGFSELTQKELETLPLIVTNDHLDQVAVDSQVARSTLDERLSSIREKLGLERTAQLRALLEELRSK